MMKGVRVGIQDATQRKGSSSLICGGDLHFKSGVGMAVSQKVRSKLCMYYV